MSEFEIVHIINILAIILFTAYLSSVVGKMKYSMWRIVIRGWIPKIWSLLFKRKISGNNIYLTFINSHRYYIACFILIPQMLWLALILIGQLDTGLIHIRPIWAIRLSPFIWITITFMTAWFQHQVKKTEKNESH